MRHLLATGFMLAACFYAGNDRYDIAAFQVACAIYLRLDKHIDTQEPKE